VFNATNEEKLGETIRGKREEREQGETLPRFTMRKGRVRR